MVLLDQVRLSLPTPYLKMAKNAYPLSVHDKIGEVKGCGHQKGCGHFQSELSVNRPYLHR